MLYTDGIYDDGELTTEDVQVATIETLLEYLSLSTIKLNIQMQINGKLESSRDFLAPVLERYEYFRTNKSESSEKKELDDEIMAFCAEVISDIADRFNIGVDPTNDDSLDYLTIADNLYTFFILNRENYTTQFLISYIQERGEDLLDVIGIPVGGTDLSSQAYKKAGMDRTTVTIISNINEIIDFVLAEDDLLPTEFFNRVDDGNLCIVNMREYYDSYQVTGNFIREYVDIVADKATEVSLRIRNNVRVSIIMKLVDSDQSPAREN